jgi:hypothetical protein
MPIAYKIRSRMISRKLLTLTAQIRIAFMVRYSFSNSIKVGKYLRLCPGGQFIRSTGVDRTIETEKHLLCLIYNQKNYFTIHQRTFLPYQNSR